MPEAKELGYVGIPEKIKNSVLEKILNKLKHLVQEYKEIPILSRTHGQPASPSILGKEIQVFVSRLEEQKITDKSDKAFSKSFVMILLTSEIIQFFIKGKSIRILFKEFSH